MFKKTGFLVFALIFGITASPALFAQQYARPDSTSSAGGFTVSGAPTLHEAIDEVTANGDTDYIVSVITSNEAHLGLSSVTDPNTGANHIMRFQAWSEKKNQVGQLTLYENSGNTLIATYNFSNPNRQAWTDLSFTLSTAEADSITDYLDLSIRFNNSAVGDAEMRVTWFELEVPDPVSVVVPTVTTPTFDLVTDTTATLGGNVTLDGGATVTNKGVEWGTSSSTGGSYPNDELVGSGGLGIFTLPVTGLPSGTLIYFRAWALNSAGRGYSSESTFTTQATITLPTATAITDSTATLGGTVSSTGVATVTDRGTVWGTSPNPTGNATSQGTGNGTFTQPVTGLPSGTLIYYRA